MMEQVFTILYDDSTPARKRISYYNALATNAGLILRWIRQSETTNGYDQLQTEDADAILISGREDFNELKEKNLTVLISHQHERRLVALFSRSIDPVYFSKQYAETYPLTVAADFEWQAQMVANFLSRGLPVRNTPYKFLCVGDDHGFDDRLTALLDARIDVAILSLCDLNESGINSLRSLKYMVLPLFECPPNIYQATTGLILKNKIPAFAQAVQKSADRESSENYHEEAALLIRNAPTSSGVFRMEVPLTSFTYLAYPDRHETKEIWKMEADFPAGIKLFSTTDYMKDFFQYEYIDEAQVPDQPVLFIASHKAVHNDKLVIGMAGRRVWVAGAKTWFELAKKGVWIEGGADGLGLETLQNIWAGFFTAIDKASVNILTNADSADNWMMDGWAATGTYKLVPSVTLEIIKGIESADAIFWTSYQQYQACRAFIKPDVLHASPAGKTAVMLKKDGIDSLVVFPSIKAFNYYREQVFTTKPGWKIPI